VRYSAAKAGLLAESLNKWLKYAFGIPSRNLETPEHYSPTTGFVNMRRSGERAFQTHGWLDKAFQAHDVSLLGIKTDPTFERFHQEPRFVELLRRVGIEP